MKIDKQASKELFQTIITEEEIKQEVVKALSADKPVELPVIGNEKIKINSSNTASAVSQYLTDSISDAYSFNNNSLSLTGDLFGAQKSSAGELKPKLDELQNKLYALNVPKDAVALHKSLIMAYSAYSDLLSSAQKFNPQDYAKNDEIWPQVYKNYVIANIAANNYSTELNKLTNKYQIAYVTVNDYYADSGKVQGPKIFLFLKPKPFWG